MLIVVNSDSPYRTLADLLGAALAWKSYKFMPTLDKSNFERTDYSVVVRQSGDHLKPWKWEIYRAGRSSPIKHSSVYFDTMTKATREGKEELKRLLAKLFL
jgi:hypothetical protein